MPRPMIDNKPVALATAHSPRRPRFRRVSVGKFVTTKSGKLAPSKRKDAEGRFCLVVLAAGTSDENGHLLEDEAVQAALREATGDENPTWVPIRVLSNELDEVMHAERAAFWGKRRWCHCGRYWVMSREEAKHPSKDLPWPWGGDGIPRDVLGNEAYYHGLFERADACGPGACKCPVGGGECYPPMCPIANGSHGVARYEGKPLCKPHIRIEFKFDDEHIELPPGASPYGYVTSTSWATHATMVGTWHDTLQNEAAGWMPGAPLRLRISKEQRVPRGQTASQDIPVWSIEANGPRSEVLAAVKRLAAHRDEVQRLLTGERRSFLALPESTEYQRETAAEFHPEVAGAEPSWIPQAKTLALAAGLSNGIIGEMVENVLAGNDTPEALLERLRGMAGEEPDEPEESDGGVTAEELSTYMREHGITREVTDAIREAADEAGLTKGAQRRAYIMATLREHVEGEAEGDDGEELPNDSTVAGPPLTDIRHYADAYHIPREDVTRWAREISLHLYSEARRPEELGGEGRAMLQKACSDWVAERAKADVKPDTGQRALL